MSWKKFLLLLCKILKLFVNTLTADDKYSVLNRDNLREPIQIPLCLKERKFSPFSSAFLKYTVNFEDFFKKDDPHGRCISEVGDSEIRD